MYLSKPPDFSKRFSTAVPELKCELSQQVFINFKP